MITGLVLLFSSLILGKKMSKFYIKQIELGFLKTMRLFFWLIFSHSIRYFLVTFCFPFRFMKERRGVLRELLRSLLFFLSCLNLHQNCQRNEEMISKWIVLSSLSLNSTSSFCSATDK